MVGCRIGEKTKEVSTPKVSDPALSNLDGERVDQAADLLLG